jgi:hypothetical protein
MATRLRIYLLFVALQLTIAAIRIYAPPSAVTARVRNPTCDHPARTASTSARTGVALNFSQPPRQELSGLSQLPAGSHHIDSENPRTIVAICAIKSIAFRTVGCIFRIILP